jgi:predicted nuclease of predicted toxin-antitoxin system
VKFLVDAQLPLALSLLIQSKGYDSIHTLDLPNRNLTTDKEILQIAQLQKRIVITKDSDFLDSFLLTGKPEKLIIVRTGNITNSSLLQLFSVQFDLIFEMLSRSSLIEITRSDIAEHD